MSESMIPSISIVIPTYNEAENLPALFSVLRPIASRVSGSEIIIADDDSPDGTAGIAARLAAERGVHLNVVTRRGQRSLARSVIEGARVARNGCIVVLDADLSHDVGQIPLLADEVTSGRASIAIASRYAKGGAIGDWPLPRRVLSALGSLPARVLTRTRDPLSGFFACRRELLLSDRLRPRGYKILLEILARNPSASVTEIPTRFVNRQRGESKLRTRQKLEYLAQLSSLFLARIGRGSRVLDYPYENHNSKGGLA